MMETQLPEELPPADSSGGQAGALKRPSLGDRCKGFVYEVLVTVLPALVIVLALNTFVARATWVEGPSMEPSLYQNQRLIIERISYYTHPPRRGDMVVLRLPQHPKPPLIKRVIALPGEIVTISDGQVLINGQALYEPYLNQKTYPGMAPRLVPEEQVFVLGDNRGFSNDSRYFGFVPFSSIIGRACFRYWPPSEIGPLP